MFKKEGWKKQLAGDLLSLGSIVFYAIIIARALIKPYWLFFAQLVVAVAALFLLSLAVKNAENRLSRALILAVLTVLFYHEIKFAIFVFLLALAMLASAVYIKVAKKAIIKGLILGAVSTIVSYFLSPIIVNFFNLPI